MNDVLLPWILQGYKTFSTQGPKALRVERLATEVGKSKSSFYHHFADLEVFSQLLLEYHMDQAKVMAVKEASCNNLEELVEVILEHRSDLLFNRQLRIYRDNPDFEKAFCRTNEITAEAFLPLWTEILELTDHTHLADMVLKLSMENFYLQITEATLNRNWLMNYFHNLRTMSREFKKTGKIPQLDGSV